MTTTRFCITFLGISELWDIIDNYIVWILALLGGIASIGWIVGCRPQAHSVSKTSFVDGESDQVVEETLYHISWGRVFFLRRMKLARIERNASFRILCKPLGGIKDTLDMNSHSEKSSGSSRTLYLVNKSVFKENEIEEVYLEVEKPAPSDYKGKIEIQRSSGRIEVLNWNHIELRSVKVELPKAMTIDKMPTYFALFDGWKTPNDQRRGIVASLKSVPPCMGGKPGRVTIPLS